MKFFRDSYCLTVSACEYFCTNHIITTVYVVVYTVVGLSSSSVYHKNQFYRSFSGGSPPAAGRAIRSNCLRQFPLLSLTRMRAVNELYLYDQISLLSAYCAASIEISNRRHSQTQSFVLLKFLLNFGFSTKIVYKNASITKINH